jgi:hypothetical protein
MQQGPLKVIPRGSRSASQIERRVAFQQARPFWRTLTDEMDHDQILGLLPDPEGGLSDITELYLAKFKLFPRFPAHPCDGLGLAVIYPQVIPQ